MVAGSNAWRPGWVKTFTPLNKTCKWGTKKKLSSQPMAPGGTITGQETPKWAWSMRVITLPSPPPPDAAYIPDRDKDILPKLLFYLVDGCIVYGFQIGVGP